MKEGLSKREYFSATALQGVLSNGNHEFMLKIRRMSDEQQKTVANIVAEVSVECADALINVLNESEVK